MRLERREFLLGQHKIGVVVGRERSHAFNLYFLGHNLGAQDGGGFNQCSRLAINLQNAGGLLRLGHGVFGRRQILLRLFHLLLKEESAPCSLSNRQGRGELSKFLHIAVGQLGSPVGIMILNCETDQPILGSRHRRGAALEFLACLGYSLGVILLHQAKALDHRVFDGTAGQQRDIHVGRVFEAKTASC